jgi:hypothetical protein
MSLITEMSMCIDHSWQRRTVSSAAAAPAVAAVAVAAAVAAVAAAVAAALVHLRSKVGVSSCCDSSMRAQTTTATAVAVAATCAADRLNT